MFLTRIHASSIHLSVIDLDQVVNREDGHSDGLWNHLFAVKLETRRHCSISTAGGCHMQHTTGTGHSCMMYLQLNARVSQHKQQNRLVYIVAAVCPSGCTVLHLHCEIHYDFMYLRWSCAKCEQFAMLTRWFLPLRTSGIY